MMKSELTEVRTLIVTTINGIEHPGIQSLIQFSNLQRYSLILIGDTKTPEYPDITSDYVSYFSIRDQMRLDFKSAQTFPRGHYARKNIGYLIAAQRNCKWIGESDDDNLCFESFWTPPSYPLAIIGPKIGHYLNTFSAMGLDALWPRGLPITSVRDASDYRIMGETKEGLIACIQGLTDDEPDVDAIARSLHETYVKFPNKSFALAPDCYAPINSQMTLWNSSYCLPLLYLPFTVSWRVADIWRGYIAQRFFAIRRWNTIYRGSVGRQIRNPHDLRVDFSEEVEVHTRTDRLVGILNTIDNWDIVEFLERTYTLMVENQLVDSKELDYVTVWLEDYLALA
jgi:hypothetical protein